MTNQVISVGISPSIQQVYYYDSIPDTSELWEHMTTVVPSGRRSNEV